VSDAVDQAGRRLRADPPATAIISDFDGTLSAIVDDPAAARPWPGARATLERLAGEYGLVAVVSGRPASFLLEHLGARGVVLYGLYGLEWVRERDVVAHPEAASWREMVELVAARAETEAPAGVGVERKGLSVTLHVRTSPDDAAWVREWSAAMATDTGLAVHPARMSAELRPPLAIDKGTVVETLLADVGAGAGRPSSGPPSRATKPHANCRHARTSASMARPA